VKVNICEPVKMVEARCGVDGTMLLTDMGGVFACGSNEHNKLGLNHRQGFLMAMKNIFTKVLSHSKYYYSQTCEIRTPLG
jgi:NIMA (never in mitosis gene a)-related kinase